MTEPSQTPVQPVTFPSVDEMFPLWGRAKGRSGRLSAVEKAAKLQNEQQRRDYQRLLDSYQRRGSDLGLAQSDLQTAREDVTYWQGRHNQYHTDHIRATNANRWHFALGMKVLAELAHMMPTAEFEPTVEIDWNGKTVIRLVNSYGMFELIFGDKLKLNVTPAEKKRKPILFELDNAGLIPMTVLGIVAHLGLPNDGQLPKRAAHVLRNEDVPPTAEGTLFSGAEVDLVDLIRAIDCHNPRCPIHGKMFRPEI